MIRKHFKPTKNPKTTQKRARQKSLANSTTTANSTANGTTTGGPANDKLKRGQLKPLQVRADAAGIDIGSQEIAVAVPPDRDPEPVRTFPTFTVDLESLADWLEQCGVRTVAMESTSVYWSPLFQILEKRGLEVFLASQRPPHQECLRPAHRRRRLPVDSTAARGGIVADLVPPTAGNLCGACHRATPAKPDAVGLASHRAHAEVTGPDESAFAL